MKFEKTEPTEPKDESKLMDEKAYLDMCVDYALKTGWVKPEQKDILIEEYLKPIYKKYIEAVNEVKSEAASEKDEEQILKTVIKRLNHILERTKRIGSTDQNNITRSIYDYRNRFCQADDYVEYAATSLADFISRLLYSKS